MARLMRRPPEMALSPVWRQMERMLSDWGMPGSLEDEPMTLPPIEMSESEDEVVVKAQIPGMKKDDIDIEVLDGGLNIRGESKRQKEQKGENVYRSEFRYGFFSRTLALPSGVDVGKAKAKLDQGILELHIPKTDEAKKRMRKIEVT